MFYSDFLAVYSEENLLVLKNRHKKTSQLAGS
jgi:hypothetical protein